MKKRTIFDLPYFKRWSDVNLMKGYDFEVKNGPKTFKTVAETIQTTGSCMVGWTDEGDTHLDVLFTYRPEFKGKIQGGIRPSSYLFISIMRMGAFGFRMDLGPIEHGYINEKLGPLGSPTAEKLTELINAVRKNLNKKPLHNKSTNKL